MNVGFHQVFNEISRLKKQNITPGMKIICREWKNFYFCRRVSPVRPAPAESPQGRKAARVGGCSGATQVAYPLFFQNQRSQKRMENFKK